MDDIQRLRDIIGQLLAEPVGNGAKARAKRAAIRGRAHQAWVEFAPEADKAEAPALAQARCPAVADFAAAIERFGSSLFDEVASMRSEAAERHLSNVVIP